jgi:hypothetical protein
MSTILSSITARYMRGLLHDTRIERDATGHDVDSAHHAFACLRSRAARCTRGSASGSGARSDAHCSLASPRSADEICLRSLPAGRGLGPQCSLSTFHPESSSRRPSLSSPALRTTDCFMLHPSSSRLTLARRERCHHLHPYLPPHPRIPCKPRTPISILFNSDRTPPCPPSTPRTSTIPSTRIPSTRWLTRARAPHAPDHVADAPCAAVDASELLEV